MKKHAIRLLVLVLALLLVLGGCASHGETMIEVGKTEISVNVYSLYLSRMKGDLARAGMDVTSDSFWASYLSTDGTTYAEYYTKQVLDGLREIAAALYLYEEEGLSLSKETKEDIDAWIEQIVTDSGEGSENKINSLLAAYGANLTTLRDAAEIEAKVAQLKEHLFGAGGSLISATAKEEFYRATYYRGYQMLIASSYYDRDFDESGHTVYYVPNDQGGASAKIAYDTENGLATAEKDKNGDTVYYLPTTNDPTVPSSSIAYDKESGVPNYKYDAEGEQILKEYTEAQMQTRLQLAEDIAEDCTGDPAKFLEYINAYSDNSEFTETFAPNGLYFSTEAYSTDEIFGAFAAELAILAEGELAVLSTDAGYYILQRVPLDSAAWQQEANNQWFTTFTDLIVEYMLQQRTERYADRVWVDAALAGRVDITSVEANFYY